MVTAKQISKLHNKVDKFVKEAGKDKLRLYGIIFICEKGVIKHKITIA